MAVVKYRSGHYIRPDVRRGPGSADEEKNHDFAVGPGISSRALGGKSRNEIAVGTEFVECLEIPRQNSGCDAAPDHFGRLVGSASLELRDRDVASVAVPRDGRTGRR